MCLHGPVRVSSSSSAAFQHTVLLRRCRRNAARNVYSLDVVGKHVALLLCSVLVADAAGQRGTLPYLPKLNVVQSSLTGFGRG